MTLIGCHGVQQYQSRKKKLITSSQMFLQLFPRNIFFYAFNSCCYIKLFLFFLLYYIFSKSNISHIFYMEIIVESIVNNRFSWTQDDSWQHLDHFSIKDQLNFAFHCFAFFLSLLFSIIPQLSNTKIYLKMSSLYTDPFGLQLMKVCLTQYLLLFFNWY